MHTRGGGATLWAEVSMPTSSASPDPLNVSKATGWLSRFGTRVRQDSQFLRHVIQAAFVLLCLWIGVEFWLFTRWGLSGGVEAYVPRPPGAEGFLPISALMSLWHWFLSGTLNTIHPASVFILVAILAIGLFLKKGFCSWLCPVGTLSEALWRLGRRLFGRNPALPRWLDILFRGLKYFFLAFFLWAIFGMFEQQLAFFLHSPYNRMADVKMYLFFARISGTGLIVLAILGALSVVVQNPWCRYLCPYGALLGFISLLSPLKITRRASTCIDCGKCTRVCPARIKVHQVQRVRSDDCTGCYSCVAACPVKDTLTMAAPQARTVPVPVYAALLVGLFVAITGAAMLAGRWQSSITREEYLRRLPQMDTPLYDHGRGQVAPYGPED